MHATITRNPIISRFIPHLPWQGTQSTHARPVHRRQFWRDLDDGAVTIACALGDIGEHPAKHQRFHDALQTVKALYAKASHEGHAEAEKLLHRLEQGLWALYENQLTFTPAAIGELFDTLEHLLAMDTSAAHHRLLAYSA